MHSMNRLSRFGATRFVTMVCVLIYSIVATVLNISMTISVASSVCTVTCWWVAVSSVLTCLVKWVVAVCLCMQDRTARTVVSALLVLVVMLVTWLRSDCDRVWM